MNSAIRRISLATVLLMLALPACARISAQSNSPQGTGEAASQERKETSVDAEVSPNRAHKASASQPKRSTAQVHPKTAVVQNASAPQHHTAQLKTGQLTSGHAAKLQTKQTAMHLNAHADDGPSQPAGDAKAKTSKPSNDIHLKKHNARMF